MPGRTGPLGLGLLIATFLLPFYFITYNGTYRVDDEHILGARAQSLALWGRLEAPQVSGNTRVQSLLPMGDQATQIEPLESILGAGLYRVGLATGGGGRQAMLLLNAYTTCLTAFVMFVTISRLGFSPGASAVTALLFGLGSMAWPYATSFFRDSLAMLMAALAFLGWILLAGPQPGSNKATGILLVLVGAVGGVFAKSSMVSMFLALLIGTLAVWISRRSSAGLRTVRLLLITGVGMAAAVLLTRIPETGPLARYSLPYYTFLAGHFWQSLTQGSLVYALGPFVSPARSLVLFSPPLILLVLLPWVRRKIGWKVALPMVVFVAGLAVEQALFYRADWAGGFGWGLRFMLPTLPPLFVLSAPVVDAALGYGRGHRAIWPLWGLLGVSALVQLAGTVVPWQAPFLAWRADGLAPYTPQASWQLKFLIIPSQLDRLVQPGSWDLAWLRILHTGSTSAVSIPLASGVILLLVLMAWRAASRSQGGFKVWLAVAGLVAACAPFTLTQTVLRSDPALAGSNDSYAHWLGWAHSHVGPDDVVIVGGYGSPLWTYMTNVWDRPVRWYSLGYRDPASGRVGPLDQGDWAILDEASARGDHMWLVDSVQRLPETGSPPASWARLGDPVAVIDGQPAVVVWRLK